MARRLCRRRKRSCTGLAPPYSSCRGKEREKTNHWGLLGGGGGGGVLSPNWAGFSPLLKRWFWIFSQKEVSRPAVHSQGNPVPRHRPTVVGQALGDTHPTPPRCHEMDFVSPRLSWMGTHQEAPRQGTEPLEGVLGGVGAQPSFDGDLWGAGTMSRCPSG